MKYEQLLSKNHALREVVRGKEDDPDKIVKIINKQMNKSKFEAFGKVKQRKKNEVETNDRVGNTNVNDIKELQRNDLRYLNSEVSKLK